MTHKYMDALVKDLDRLFKELETHHKALKQAPGNAAAQAAIKKLAPFLTKEAVEKRYELAQKMDLQETGKMIKQCGLPGW